MRLPWTQREVPAVQAALGARGFFAGTDYRGERVFTNLDVVPGASWFVVTKIDQREALADWNVRSRLMISLGFLVVVFAVGLLHWIRIKARESDQKTALEASRAVAEEAQQQAEQKLAQLRNALLDHSAVGIMLTDYRRVVVEVSQRMGEMFGYQKSDLLGKSTQQLYLSVDDFEQFGQFYEILRRDGSVEVAHCYRHCDGRSIWCSVMGTLLDPLVPERGAIWSFVDITEQQRLAEESASRQKMLSEILESIPAAVSFWNAKDEHNIFNVFSNTTYASMYETTPDQLVGMHVRDLLGQEIYDLHWPKMCQARLGEHLAYNRFQPSVNGKPPRHVQIHYVPDIRQGEPVGLYVMMFDTTELRRTEEAMQAAKEAAEAASRAKGEFLANMSHEIRTPMNGIIGMTSLLMDAGLNSHQQHYARIIASSAQALLGVINDILDFSKVEAGKMNIEVIHFDLRGLLAEIGELMTLRASEKSLVFHLDVTPEVPQWVQGDPTRVRQVLNNFLGNALKFTVAGAITLRVLLVRGETAEDRIRFEIMDSGIGIPPETLGKLFSPFSQGDASTTRKFGGTGLGLVICKQLAELMNGQVGVTSEEFKGSTFWVELPLPMGEETEGTASKGLQLEFNPALAEQNARVRVLLVEDNPTNQFVAVSLLQKFGYKQTSVASNGQEALQVIELEPVDVVLMDCQMPIMDGFEATRRLRQAGNQVPVIAMTANVMRGDREQCLSAGMNDYIGKPFSPQELLDALVRWTLNGVQQVAEPVHDHSEMLAQPRVTNPGEPPAIVPVFDRAGALARLAGDQDLLQQMIGMAIEDIAAELAQLNALLQGSAIDWAECRRAAHTIKGLAANIGAERLRAAALLVEDGAKAADLVLVRQGMPGIAASYEEFQQGIAAG